MGLATLFFTELWERFSYYGMLAILVLYLAADEESGGMHLPGTTAIGNIVARRELDAASIRDGALVPRAIVFGAACVHQSMMPKDWGVPRSVWFGEIERDLPVKIYPPVAPIGTQPIACS